MFVYELISENLSALGGQMGTEHTWDNWTKLFINLDLAKEYAEHDYHRNEGGKKTDKLKWHRDNGRLSTDDLRTVLYLIRKIKVRGS